jgi:type IV secretion system protein TrbI
VTPQAPRFPDAPPPAGASDAPLPVSPRPLRSTSAASPPISASAFRSPLLLRPPASPVEDSAALPVDLHAPPRYVIASGAAIPAVLVTEIRSTLPGLVVAQIERDIYDTPSLSHILIPRGSRLLGHYDAHVVQGEDALLVVWTRLTFPDGRWLSLPGFESADAGGTSGLRGSVDSHLARAYVNAGLMSLVGAGAQLSQPPASVPYGVASPGQVVAGSLGQQVTEESLDLLRTDSHLAPTVTVRGGTSFLVMVSRDLVFDRAYSP